MSDDGASGVGWVSFEGRWDALRRHLGMRGAEAPVGLRVRLADGTEHVVGTINQLGGLCDDCSINGDNIAAYALPVDLRAAVRAFLDAHDAGRSVREEMKALRSLLGSN